MWFFSTWFEPLKIKNLTSPKSKWKHFVIRSHNMKFQIRSHIEVWVSSDFSHSCNNSNDVAIDKSDRLTESNRGNGCGCISENNIEFHFSIFSWFFWSYNISYRFSIFFMIVLILKHQRFQNLTCPHLVTLWAVIRKYEAFLRRIAPQLEREKKQMKII